MRVAPVVGVGRGKAMVSSAGSCELHTLCAMFNGTPTTSFQLFEFSFVPEVSNIMTLAIS